MLSKNTQKIIRSLQQKKQREERRLFVAEGPRVVAELFHSEFSLHQLFATKEWILANASLLTGITDRVTEVSEQELKSVSNLSTPQEVLALVCLPSRPFNPETAWKSLSLALDNVQDPGNMGTIIRLAEWFGIEDIFCSQGTADPYAPKVVQASMGSVFRVRIHSLDLNGLFKELKKEPGFLVYGTFPEGDPVYESSLGQKGIILMGNEGSGISPGLQPLIDRKISIPPYTKKTRMDSLNVSIATAIICAEFRRRK